MDNRDREILRRAIAASAMGNATEWYDYGIYAFVAGTMGRVFFPSDDPVVSLLSAYGVFAVSFVVRPFGGMVFGPLGDRLGRQKILALTIIVMSACTFLIGLLPGYRTLGAAAPVLLIALRLVQGFSTGGEYGGAATFMAEYSPDDKRGFCGSFLEFGTLSGYIFGAAVVAATHFVLGDLAMESWGWRIPFLLAGPLGGVGLYLRSKLEDTPVFRELAESQPPTPHAASPFSALFGHWRPILVCMGMVIMLNGVDYTLLTYMPEYLKGPLHLSSNSALLVTIAAYVGMLGAVTFAGRLSDRVGRKPLWYASGGAILLLSVPAFLLMGRGWGFALVGFVALGLLFSLQLGTVSATFPALFPTSVRYSGFAISYNLATSLFGGTAPLIISYLIDKTGNDLMPAFYMMATCAIGLVAVGFSPETRGLSLRGTGNVRQAEITKREAA
ncbi:MFS transporter [Pendulispora rubella]|uniref:MFS transporter n=1 Tax=Pendulispora rubella TaxID=2741070 RepID=A0ABZ2L976_9BACT